MNSNTRITLAFVIGLVLGIVINFLNRQDLFLALQSGFLFAIFVAVIVAVLSWGIDVAVKKGYPDWMGFLLVFVLNVFGFLVLAILPDRTKASSQIRK